MLGESIKRVFKKDDMIYTDKGDLDVASYDSVMNIITRLDKNIDYILHLAAETDLEYCDKYPERAYYTNTIGTINMCKLAGILKVPIIYISTAGVFLGEKNCYDENDNPEPVNHYGRSKYYGELAVKAYPKHYIFRMSWAMGGGPELDKKFVNKIFKLIKGGATEIHAISDVYGSPTYGYDVARTIHACLTRKIPYGLYHTAGLGPKASRYDVAQAIVDILKLKVEVVPVQSSYFYDKFPCPRARSEVLVSRKPHPSHMRNWRASLREYLEEYYA
jgi:dTDP-4-dehydrorhamnose reductase